MKTFNFLLVSLLSVLLSAPVMATTPTKDTTTTTKTKRPTIKIVFNGTWKRWIKSVLPSQPPVEAWADEEAKEVTLQFLENLGEVEVTLTLTSGKIAYKETVDTATSPSLLIKLDSEETVYTLSVSNEYNCISGEIVFEE